MRVPIEVGGRVGGCTGGPGGLGGGRLRPAGARRPPGGVSCGCPPRCALCSLLGQWEGSGRGGGWCVWDAARQAAGSVPGVAPEVVMRVPTEGARAALACAASRGCQEAALPAHAAGAARCRPPAPSNPEHPLGLRGARPQGLPPRRQLAGSPTVPPPLLPLVPTAGLRGARPPKGAFTRRPPTILLLTCLVCFVRLLCGVPAGLRGARPQGPLQGGARGQDQKLHGHRRPL